MHHPASSPSDQYLSHQHRLPRRTLPTSSKPPNHILPLTSGQATPGSLEYMKKSQVAMDRQREAFEEERALWRIERGELLQRITALEVSLQQKQTQSAASTAKAPMDRHFINHEDAPPSDQSRHSSTSSTGSEIWRGSNPFQNPTRTFSESSSTSNKPPHRLTSIAESSTQTHPTSPPERRVSINPLPENITLHQPVSGAAIDRNLDGITFKSSGLAPDLLEKVKSESPSPRSSPAVASPTTASEEVMSPLTLPALGALKRDPYTMDAGHTPLARGRPHPLTTVDGAESTGDSSGGVSTPTAPPTDQPHPYGSDGAQEGEERWVKPPSERRDSYFPLLQEEDNQPSVDPDPELQGPLGLTSDAVGEGGGNDDFLKELNSKLVGVEEKEETPSEADTDVGMNEGDDNGGQGDKGEQEGKEDGKVFEQPEHEPRLRIKRSMNFGSQLGSGKVGKSF